MLKNSYFSSAHLAFFSKLLMITFASPSSQKKKKENPNDLICLSHLGWYGKLLLPSVRRPNGEDFNTVVQKRAGLLPTDLLLKLSHSPRKLMGSL